MNIDTAPARHSLLSIILGVCCGVQGAAADVTLTSQAVQSSITWNDVTVIASPPQDQTRLLVGNKFGQIEILNPYEPNPTVTRFLSVPWVSPAGEAGLLGLAFHPDYTHNGAFYVLYTATNPTWITVARGQRSATNPNTAEPTVSRVLLITGETPLHNAGWIGFGPDGYLYVAVGDGTNGNSSQTITNNLRGKILRIDVDGFDNIPGNSDDDAFPADANKNYSIPPDNPFVNITGDDEIWAYGLRNPWRCSFDRLTGDLWIADVGGNIEEEINVAPAGVGGLNYGWPCREGRTVRTCSVFPPPTNLVTPWASFTHDVISPPPYLPVAGNYIIGGYVYRGESIPCLRGQYIFGDGGNQIHTVWRSPDGQPRYPQSRPGLLIPTSFTYTFGEDSLGELYFVSSRTLRRIVAANLAGPDCNNNGIPNDCEIIQGLSLDVNDNGIPDNCECDSIDFNNDTSVFDPQDIEAFLSIFGEGPCIPPAATCNDIDFNNDGSSFDPADIAAFLRVYSEGNCL